MWDIISEKLKIIIDANSLVERSYDFEASRFDGTPVVTITPSANENDYHSTTENTRVYAFMVRLYTERLSGANEEHQTEAAMRELVDSVLDDFDKNHRLSGLATKTGYTFLFLDAAPSSWGYAGRENEYRVAEMIIRVHVNIDVNTIS